MICCFVSSLPRNYDRLLTKKLKVFSSEKKIKKKKKNFMKRSASELEDGESPPSKKQKVEDPNVKYPSIPIDGDNLLSVLLHPLKKDEFIEKYWTKKDYHVSIDDPERVKDLLNGPFPFHLKTLLQETASQNSCLDENKNDRFIIKKRKK